MIDYLIKKKLFSDINDLDIFFDSLKADYEEFNDWFLGKAKVNSEAFVIESKTGLEAFLYLKEEYESLDDISPILPLKRRLKVGTLKINPHGTKLGERFIKKIFDTAINLGIQEIYITIFPKHKTLIELVLRYGFIHMAKKSTQNGVENVYLRSLNLFHQNILLDYPLISLRSSKFILAIYPQFHTRLFPDSKLQHEKHNKIEDTSHTNSIHKIYICFMDVSMLKEGDLILIYRTSDGKGPAEYRSVATAVCVVEELYSKEEFANKQDFIDYCKKYSVFEESELSKWYNYSRVFVIKMTYNFSLEKRVTRNILINKIGLNRDNYWGFFQLTNQQFNDILNIGGVNESLIIN